MFACAPYPADDAFLREVRLHARSCCHGNASKAACLPLLQCKKGTPPALLSHLIMLPAVRWHAMACSHVACHAAPHHAAPCSAAMPPCHALVGMHVHPWSMPCHAMPLQLRCPAEPWRMHHGMPGAMPLMATCAHTGAMPCLQRGPHGISIGCALPVPPLQAWLEAGHQVARLSSHPSIAIWGERALSDRPHGGVMHGQG